MNQYYYQLSVKSSIRKELFEYACQVTDWGPKENLNFLQISAPREIIEKDPILFKLTNTLQDHYDRGAKIFKMPPWVYYELHTDKLRPCAVNMLLNENSNSTSFFEVSRFREAQINFHELVYETDSLYLFNTQIPHAVMNKDADRYVLSIAMNGVGNYENSINFLKNNNW